MEDRDKKGCFDVPTGMFAEETEERIERDISRARRMVKLNPFDTEYKAALLEKLFEAKSHFPNRYLPAYVSFIAKSSRYELHELKLYFEGSPSDWSAGVLRSIRGAHGKRKARVVEDLIAAGLKEKAKELLKEMEDEDLPKNPQVGKYIIRSYAKLADTTEMRRIWQLCKACPQREVCLGAIEAFGLVNQIDEAEAVLEFMSKRWRLIPRNYSLMLKIYANNKMVKKGKDLVKRMADSGMRIGPLTWDDLVNLHIKAGEVENAETILEKAVLQNQGKPFINSYTAIMEMYAQKGDIHNTKRIWRKMDDEMGYKLTSKQYEVLMQAYSTAKVPVR
ncbi:hypothetical protein HN51_049627 [Arachis hypogaea]